MSNDTKATNPKDRVAGTKLPCGLVPDSATAHLALAFLEGALKYGRYNWRLAGVSASVYNDAMERHRKKWWNGQNCDPKTLVHHLANLMACCAIVLDAELCKMLNDDRPPAAPVADQIDDMQAVVVHLKELFKDHDPYQYTIADTRNEKIRAAFEAITAVATREARVECIEHDMIDDALAVQQYDFLAD